MAEGARLESAQAGNRLGGSNPSLSATDGIVFPRAAGRQRRPGLNPAVRHRQHRPKPDRPEPLVSGGSDPPPRSAAQPSGRVRPRLFAGGGAFF